MKNLTNGPKTDKVSNKGITWHLWKTKQISHDQCNSYRKIATFYHTKPGCLFLVKKTTPQTENNDGDSYPENMWPKFQYNLFNSFKTLLQK